MESAIDFPANILPRAIESFELLMALPPLNVEVVKRRPGPLTMLFDKLLELIVWLMAAERVLRTSFAT